MAGNGIGIIDNAQCASGSGKQGTSEQTVEFERRLGNGQYYPFIGVLRPEFMFFGGSHLSGTAGAGVLVPDSDVAAATLQAQSSCLATERGGDIGDDTADNDVLNGVTVGTRHGRNLLIEKTTPFIDSGFVTALVAAVFEFVGHER